MARLVSDVLDIMRVAIGRRNGNDPDSNDEKLLDYLNDFYSLTMSDDVRLFEQFGTMSFTIDETIGTGVYNFSDLDVDSDFVSIGQEAFISLLDPENNSVSWNQLSIYQDPGEFFSIWGINNNEILIPGYPTNVLFYGNELTFRTIPDTAYLVKIYGYKMNSDFQTQNDILSNPRWLRYLAYGAALNYATDYRYDQNTLAGIQRGFAREKQLMLQHTHNQIKNSRAMPRF